jgi:2-polyprenyl-3-methyl-5-hydroxy-6-metoxy-1,4-benzoquinol methylase
MSAYYWYHVLDVGNGLVTPGLYDFRDTISAFDFPDDMKGMDVLDIGSATGYFSFEFEKRGARVVSVDLPSIADWDMPLKDDKERTLRELMEAQKAETIEEAHYRHIVAPYDFCHKVLGSKARRVFSRIYDLNEERLGCEAFDTVFIGDLLLHIFSPLQALATVAPLCRKNLIISQTIPEMLNLLPLALYIGGESREGDARSWWFPNRLCLTQILKRLGFTKIEIVGYHSGVYQYSGTPYGRRAVLRATK